jgi:hypothetical protein
MASRSRRPLPAPRVARQACQVHNKLVLLARTCLTGAARCGRHAPWCEWCAKDLPRGPRAGEGRPRPRVSPVRSARCRQRSLSCALRGCEDHIECFNADRPLLCMLHRVQHARTRVRVRASAQLAQICQESSQLLGAMIMWSAGRDQHRKVCHRECCSMSSTAKSSFSSWSLVPDQLWVQPGARQSLKNPPAPDLSRGTHTQTHNTVEMSATPRDARHV